MTGRGGPDPYDDAYGESSGPGDGDGRDGPGRGSDPGLPSHPAGPPRIPPPRSAAEDSGHWPGALDGQIPAPRPPTADETPAGRAPESAPKPAANAEPGEPAPGPDPEPALGPDPEPALSHDPEPDSAPEPPASAPLPAPAPPDAPPAAPLAAPTPSAAHPLSHDLLRSLLGAWALTACSPEETAAVEAHLNHCPSCAEEALRLRDAVGLLHTEHSLDLDPMLRSRVLAGCLGRRPARIPMPGWAGAYDAEAARLDALLRDMGEAEWRAPVRLKWFDGRRLTGRDTTVAGVIGHLMVVDGIIAASLGLPDPLGADAPRSPQVRTEAYWRHEPGASYGAGPPGAVRELWREQGHALVRTVSFAGRGVAELDVPYGDFALPIRDAFLDRALECWVHAGDIAEAIDYPYEPPASAHLRAMIDLCVRLLPGTLAERRRAGLAAPPRRLVEAGTPGRTLHLQVEGTGGGDWYIALDSPAAVAAPEEAVATIALDQEAFYLLASGHVPPQEAAAGLSGDTEAIRDVLFATASLSRL
ncbi:MULTISPECIES: zf-HC2 domain-containing protein [Streptomyces]|uniref:zf-HC2 domain-containing protein n=1 Tax=Streptomyces TaxID=1883 RepID=UPI001B335572|nr:zf-HC2 domain-containing protein [Streptomyces sp. AgN23]AJZ86094.2 zf-HC2 domain-containing protein [Streptomyces sp. AgN23]WTA82279.1 zf-HC2 domain-containing protein [Streptomyces antimycoticus]